MSPGLRLLASSKNGAKVEQGTGFVLHPGLVVTAFHVVGNKEMRLWKHEDPQWSGCVYTLPDVGAMVLEPLLYDPRADVAILVATEPRHFAEDDFVVPAAMPPAPGEGFYVEGFPNLSGSAARRGVTLSGEMQRFSPEPLASAMQLLLRQGTTLTWEGMSGSAVRNRNDEVIGILTQTMTGSATAWAAPVEGVERLLRMRDAADWVSRIVALLSASADLEALVANVVDGLGWAVFDFSAATIEKLVQRAAQEGGFGLSDLLERAGKEEPKLSVEALLAEIREKERGEATEAELLRLLRGFVPGKAMTAGGLVDLLHGELSAEVVQRAAARLVERGWLERRQTGAFEVSLSGAKRALRRDHGLAILRKLPGATALGREELGGRLPFLSAGAFERAMGLARLVGWVEVSPREIVRSTAVGQKILREADEGLEGVWER